MRNWNSIDWIPSLDPKDELNNPLILDRMSFQGLPFPNVWESKCRLDSKVSKSHLALVLFDSTTIEKWTNHLEGLVMNPKKRRKICPFQNLMDSSLGLFDLD